MRIFKIKELMRSQQLLLVLAGFLVLACNDQNNEQKPGDPVSPEISEQAGDSLASTEAFLIEDGAAGNFKLGAPIPRALEAYSISREEQVRTTEEGPTEETVYTVSQGNEQLLQLLPDVDPNTGESTEDIGELRITSEKFRTAAQIGVNSTLEEFIAAYPQYRIWYTYVSDMYVVEAEEVQAQFLLEEEDFTGDLQVSSEMTSLSREDFRQGARIRMVRMFR